MAKISDEIREWVRRALADEHMDLRELDALADRVDRELGELPRDRDGVPIHIGDTVWDVEDGMEFEAKSFTMYAGGAASVNAFRDGCDAHIGSTHFTRKRPDSLERIADELEELSESNRINGSEEVFYRAGDLADRIRKLAKREGTR